MDSHKKGKLTRINWSLIFLVHLIEFLVKDSDNVFSSVRRREAEENEF